MLLHDTLTQTVARLPQRPAVISEGQVTSFSQIDRDSEALARTLKDAGVERGDRVAVCLDNTVEIVTSIYGILKAGGVFVLIHPATRAAKMRTLLQDCEPMAVIAAAQIQAAVCEAAHGLPLPRTFVWVSGDHRGADRDDRHWSDAIARRGVPPAAPHVTADDLAAIIYTSGSIGDAKGVMLTHRNLVNTTGVIGDYLRNTPDDVVCCALPLSFSYGLCQALVGARVGYTLLLERSFTFPADVLHRMHQHHVTGLPAVPTMIARLVQMLPMDGVDLSSLRYITNAAAPLPPAHIHALRAALPHVEFFSMYGQTECTRTTYLDPARLHDKSASVGKAIANSEAFVVDEHGRRVGPGAAGELVVRGANVMRGYWRKPEETRHILRAIDATSEPALHTCDLFRMDEEGFLYFVGRSDDVFKCRGEKVSPREIENVLCQLPEIAEAAVVGVEDAIDGMAIKAVILPLACAAITEQRIRQHCRTNLEPHLMPKHIEVRVSLPKTESGKVRKRDLRVTNVATGRMSPQSEGTADERG